MGEREGEKKQLSVPLYKGFRKVLDILWLITKIIIPVSCIITVMEYIALMEVVATFFAPIMALAGLPGEAAVALALGYLVNYYAAVGAIVALSLSTSEITTLAVMLGICHELPVESAVCSHTGLKIPCSFALRISISLLAGTALFSILQLTGGI